MAIYFAVVNSLCLAQSLGYFPAASVPTTASKLARENIQMQTILIWVVVRVNTFNLRISGLSTVNNVCDGKIIGWQKG
ncbi:hypothetical protein [Shewanella septentrionalis]|uniref:Uncharacterized protein n=1 Tax=Shewanella septentrionalis TaxID=2952223 RepID=A0A9X2WWC7_9GAMM|nr:hypothetical protein [Shewanella septentrionalis]MCT7946762.1 hypothetical protein [Shewanella septentrionalis]